VFIKLKVSRSEAKFLHATFLPNNPEFSSQAFQNPFLSIYN